MSSPCEICKHRYDIPENYVPSCALVEEHKISTGECSGNNYKCFEVEGEVFIEKEEMEI